MQAENVSVPLIGMTFFHFNNICYVMGLGYGLCHQFLLFQDRLYFHEMFIQAKVGKLTSDSSH